MKAKRVNENIKFKRGEESKKALDVGIERINNPNNYANHSSYHTKKTNEEYLSEIMENLWDFSHTLQMDMATWSADGEDYKLHPKSDLVEISLSKTVDQLEKTIRILRSIKR